MSLLSFNVGVELGQLLVLAITVPVLSFVFKRWLPELMGTIVLSAFLAHTGWHWMIDRGATLMQYQFTLPTLSFTFAATLMRWVMLALIIFGTAWVLKGAFGALGKRHPGGGPRPQEPQGGAGPVGGDAQGHAPVAAES
jgi:hypothetical protein